VTDPEPGCEVRCVEDRAYLLKFQMANEFLLMPFRGNGTDLPGLLQRRRQAVFDVLHERLDGGEPHVAGDRAIAALALYMGQEVRYQSSVDLFDMELRRSGLQSLCRKQEQQTEAVGIGFAGVGTVPALGGHVVAQIARDQWRKECHADLPATKASANSAIWPISSGVASRYQYVCRMCAWPR